MNSNKLSSLSLKECDNQKRCVWQYTAHNFTPLSYLCVFPMCAGICRMCPVGEKQPLGVEREDVFVVRD